MGRASGREADFSALFQTALSILSLKQMANQALGEKCVCPYAKRIEGEKCVRTENVFNFILHLCLSGPVPCFARIPC